MPAIPLLSANAYLAPPDIGPHAFVALAKKAGFGGVAWNQRTVQEHDAAALAAHCAAEGMAITSLNSAGYFTWTDPARQAAQDAQNLWLVEQAARLGAGHLVVITGGIDGGLDAPAPAAGMAAQTLATARARVTEGLARLDRRAAELGVRLALELIHPVDQLRKGCVHGVAEGLSLVADLPQTDLVLDTYHSCWDRDLTAFPAPDLGRLGFLQVCNVTEPHPDAKPVRSLPAEGRFDLQAMMNHYAARGYAGAVEFEMFDHHRQGRSVAALLEAAQAQLARICALAWSATPAVEGPLP